MKDNFNLIKFLTTDRNKGIIIWLLNIGAEKYWNKVNQGIIDKEEETVINRIEEINLLICREQDFIILREEPDDIYLDILRKTGFTIPNILVINEPDTLSPISELVLKDTKILRELKEISSMHEEVYFVPYAVTKMEEQIALYCGLKLPISNPDINRKINDKVFNRSIAENLGFPVCKGKLCHTVEEISEEYFKLTKNIPYFEKIVIKEPYGASGKGLYIVENEKNLKNILRSLARIQKKDSNSQWLVEGWYSKKADINYQLNISPEGDIDVFSIKNQILRETVYLGSKTPSDLNEETKNKYKIYGNKIGNILYNLGFYGVAGIDSIILNDETIIPIVEINGRFTLSTYISFLERIFGKAKILTRYYRVVSKSSFDYKTLCKLLDEKGIHYSKSSNEGVLVYASGTLPVRKQQNSDLYLGRIFTLVISDNWENANLYIEILDNLIDYINNVKEGENEKIIFK